MRTFYLIFYAIILISCSNYSSPKIDNSKEVVSKFISDSNCVDAVDTFKLAKLDLIQTCQILFDDSLDYYFQRHVFIPGATTPYNRFEDDQLLKYVKKGDTLELKILYLSPIEYNLRPGIIQMKDDTLFVMEHVESKGERILLGYDRITEFRYVFLLKDSSYIPMIKRRFD